jgi:hypothetical protein
MLESVQRYALVAHVRLWRDFAGVWPTPWNKERGANNAGAVPDFRLWLIPLKKTGSNSL